MTENEARIIELKERQALSAAYSKAIERGEVDKGTLLLREKMMYDNIIEAWKKVPYSEEYRKYTGNPVLMAIARGNHVSN